MGITSWVLFTDFYMKRNEYIFLSCQFSFAKTTSKVAGEMLYYSELREKPMFRTKVWT